MDLGLGSFVFTIIFWIFGLVVLYMVISIAVGEGINKSIVGQLNEKKYGSPVEKKSFLDRDLDNDE